EAERLDPRNANLLTQHALLYVARRRFPEALKTAARILEIKPADADILALKAAIAQAQGNLGAASALLASLGPVSVADSGAWEAQVYQAILERHTAQIIPQLEKVLSEPNPALGYYTGELLFWLGWAKEVAGDRSAARETWARAKR